jgi:hypothetical protein
MIAGDHLDRDAGRAAPRRSLPWPFARWVDEAHQTQKLDAAFDVIEGDTRLAGRQPLHGEAEQPFAMVGRLRDPLFPVSRIDPAITITSSGAPLRKITWSAAGPHGASP